MKFLKFFFTLCLIVLLGGFIALGFIDVPIEQQEIVKDIPNETLLNNN